MTEGYHAQPAFAVSPSSGATGMNRLVKTITFTGAAGLGAIGNVPIATTTGSILVKSITAVCGTTLVGATATLALGTTNQTTQFIAATTATTITSTNSIWVGTPTQGSIDLPAACTNVIVAENIVGTVVTAAITAGVLTIVVYWDPLSNNGSLA